MLMAGEKLMQCSVCEHLTIVPKKNPADRIRCKRCGNAILKTVKAQPTNIHGVGRNKVADLGLALLMEMGAGAPDIEEKEWGIK